MAQVSETLGGSVEQFAAILDALGVFDDEEVSDDGNDTE